MDSPFMEAVAKGLCARGVTVVRFEFPYMAARRAQGTRAPPNRMPILEAAYREVVAKFANQKRLFIGGKSMGGRVATMIADSVAVHGVVALGYPFHPPKRPERTRVEHLATLRTPCLIVQGTRDPLGTEAEVRSYPLSAGIEVHFLPDGDHSFEPRRSSGRSTDDNMRQAIEAVVSFLAR